MSERLTPERLAEFEDLAAGKLTEHRRADMLAKGEHGSHVWCYDPRPDGSGPLNLHSEECHLRTLLSHIDFQQAEIDRLAAIRKQAQMTREWVYSTAKLEKQIRLEGVREFVRRVDAKAEADMLSGNPLTGAHNRAIRSILDEMEAEMDVE